MEAFCADVGDADDEENEGESLPYVSFVGVFFFAKRRKKMFANLSLTRPTFPIFSFIFVLLALPGCKLHFIHNVRKMWRLRRNDDKDDKTEKSKLTSDTCTVLGLPSAHWHYTHSRWVCRLLFFSSSSFLITINVRFRTPFGWCDTVAASTPSLLVTAKIE